MLLGLFRNGLGLIKAAVCVMIRDNWMPFKGLIRCSLINLAGFSISKKVYSK